MLLIPVWDARLRAGIFRLQGHVFGEMPADRRKRNQIPRCKQRGINLATLQSSGVFDPRGIRQLAVQARPLGSLLAGINGGTGIIQSPSRIGA